MAGNSGKGGARMNKGDLIGAISTKTGFSRGDTRVVIDTILEGIVEILAKGERLEIRGLGTFDTRERASRVGRNISTGKVVPIPPRRVPVFIPGKVIKRIVNN